MKALRGAALVAAGLVFLLDRDAVLRLLFTGVGLYLIYAGVSAILWLVYQPRPRGPSSLRRQPRLRGVAAAGRRSPHWWPPC